MPEHSLAHAKINLYLHLTARRSDGYHELDSLAVFAETADMLTLEESAPTGRGMALVIDGPFGAGLEAGSENLVLRAAAALRDAVAHRECLTEWQIRLTKNLPVASGIGGGSADAAAALRLLAAAWQCTDVDLVPIAASLGADVPVCLARKPQRMQGIGERLIEAPLLPRCAIVLVNPGVAVPTPAVFQAWKGSGTPFKFAATLPKQWYSVREMCETLYLTTNDLQAPAIALYPIIDSVLQALIASEACLFARMSGSGATCFGLYADLPEAMHAARTFRAKGWWSEAGWIQSA